MTKGQARKAFLTLARATRPDRVLPERKKASDKIPGVSGATVRWRVAEGVVNGVHFPMHLGKLMGWQMIVAPSANGVKLDEWVWRIVSKWQTRSGTAASQEAARDLAVTSVLRETTKLKRRRETV